MSHKLSVIQSDERFKRLVNNLHHTYTGKTYTRTDSDKQVSLQSLDSVSIYNFFKSIRLMQYNFHFFIFCQLSRTSFPLCMRQLHTTLKTQHHLRHFGRQQFSLFLKGIGFSLEDALIFWRTEFTKKMDSDQVYVKMAVNSLFYYYLMYIRSV